MKGAGFIFSAIGILLILVNFAFITPFLDDISPYTAKQFYLTARQFYLDVSENDREIVKETLNIDIPEDVEISDFAQSNDILYHFAMKTEMFPGAESQLKNALGSPYILGENQPDYLGNEGKWETVSDLPVPLIREITDENILCYYYGRMNIKGFSTVCDCIPDIFVAVYEQNGKEYLYFYSF